MDSGFVDNDGVRLHYLSSGSRDTAVVCAPGLSDGAEDYAQVLEALAPRRAVALSFRGQGRSQAPDRGYDLGDHVSDLHAVVEGLGLGRSVLFGHSRGAAHVIAYAARHPERVAGLVLGDAAAVHRAFPPEWVSEFGASRWRGQRVDERIAPAVLARIQAEARHVELWEQLAGLAVPVTAVLAGSHPAQVLEEATGRYREAGARVVVFDEAGHALWEPDFDRFVALLEDAAAQADDA